MRGAAELALGGSTVLMWIALRRRVGVRAAEDVRVAERVPGAAVLFGRGRRRALPVLQRLPPGVDRRAILGGARVVPHGRAVGARGGRVYVVAEELGVQRVGARAARVAAGAAVQVPERTRRPCPARVGVLDDADE